MLTKNKIRLGELLLRYQLISEIDLNKAIDMQRISGKKLGQVLIELGAIKEQQLIHLIAEHLSIPFIDLKTYSVDNQAVVLLAEERARQLRALVIKEEKNQLVVGMVDPQDVVAHDELMRLLKRSLKIVLVADSDLTWALNHFYSHHEEILHYAEEVSKEISEVSFDISQLNDNFATTDIPVIKLLKSIFEDAARLQASDIHIEPAQDNIRIRLRIDGVLTENIVKDSRIAQPLAQSIKLMARLNIAEKRLPQDGRFSLKINQQHYDVRLSTLPTEYGESVVMRLLNQSAGLLNLGELGLSSSLLTELHRIMYQPHGILLVTGPTGSGKTTMLYAMLNELNSIERKIITVEDPVEYRLQRVNQVQINTKIELTFARVLRAMLRQDPDIIMVGELRDEETASIALRAALTGHLVLSTLHTNGAVSSIIRLMDMGVEPFLIAAALRGVLALRLVRRVCQYCQQDYQPTENELAWLKTVITEIPASSTFKKGSKCSQCRNTGYQGRIGVYELLTLTPAIVEAVRTGNNLKMAASMSEQPVFTPLIKHAAELAMAGITTLTEIMELEV